MSLTQRFLNILTDAASSLRAVDTPVSGRLHLLRVMQPRSRKKFHCVCCKLLILFPTTERTQVSSEQAEHQKAPESAVGASRFRQPPKEGAFVSCASFQETKLAEQGLAGDRLSAGKSCLSSKENTTTSTSFYFN